MIERSHRRKTPKTQPNPDVLLRLHERLASQRLWFFRLLIASGLALAVSFILWLVRVPLVWHLVGIVFGFIAGLFVQRSMKSWALTWIRERAGLSYETALEQQQNDDFGFSTSLKERASDEASRLSLPKYQAWWLPMLAVAAGLAFLPLIPSLTNLPTALTTQPTQAPLPEASGQPANSVEPSEPQPTTQPVAQPPQEGQAPSQDTSEADTSQLEGATGSSASSSDSQSADDQALDRFLDNLRQNEQSQDQAPDVDLSSVMQPSGSNSGQPSNEDQGSRPRNEQNNPFEQAGQNQNSEAQQGQQQQAPQDAAQNGEEGEGGQNAQGQQAQSQTEEGQASSQSEQPQGSEQSAAQQGQEQQGQGQQGEGQEGEQQQGEQGQEGAGESGMNAQGQQEGSSDSGQNAEGAGSLAGTPTEGNTEVTGSSQQNPDFLPGQISEGPNNVAGTARLPGETEEVVFPEGSAPGSFSRAEEEALTEGRIPLEYQEVIRNYFRSE
jgi:hypothetical protein